MKWLKKQQSSNKRTNVRVYLDFASATPVDEGVRRVMDRYFSRDFGNPGTISQEGLVAKEALDSARTIIARTISTRSKEIIFTSGGTESNNLAITALVKALKEKETRSLKDIHIVTSVIEHSSVLEVVRALERGGVSVTYIPASRDGMVDSKIVEKALTEKTVLVSIMYVNNEIGVINPIADISRAVKRFRVKHSTFYPYLHTDASQAPLFLDCTPEKLGVDLMTIDGGKIYGPKGIGFLYKKREVPLSPIFEGGGQESTLRSGTENIPLIVGLAYAFEKAQKEKDVQSDRFLKLRNYFIDSIKSQVPRAVFNSSRGANTVPSIINISIPDMLGEFLVVALDTKGVATTSRSACLSSEEGSYVVRAMSDSEKRARGTVRFSLGRSTTKADIDYAVRALAETVDLSANIDR